MQTRKGGFELEDLVVRAANMISDLAQVCYLLPLNPVSSALKYLVCAFLPLGFRSQQKLIVRVG